MSLPPDGLPLSEQLSAAFVAFTLEADDIAEQTMRHRTTRGDPSEGVWLTSLAMWFNCLRWLPAEGITVAELRRRARTNTNLDGMRRWGYVTIGGSARRTKPYPQDALVVPTRRGRAAQKGWKGIPGVVENRWSQRFGADRIGRLHDALLSITASTELVLPDTLPILGSGLSCHHRGDPPLADWPRRDPAATARDGALPLVCLLARVLLELALSYEDGARISLAIQSDIVSWLADGPVALRDLPARAGVSREGIDMGVGFLQRTQCAVLEPRPGATRGQQARLTDRGEDARLAGRRRQGRIHAEFSRRHGRGAATELARALAPIVGDATRDGSPLFAGLTPSPGGWRAPKPPAQRLPRFPLVLHRGGYPDGA
jgi:hypothetical protein